MCKPVSFRRDEKSVLQPVRHGKTIDQLFELDREARPQSNHRKRNGVMTRIGGRRGVKACACRAPHRGSSGVRLVLNSGRVVLVTTFCASGGPRVIAIWRKLCSDARLVPTIADNKAKIALWPTESVRPAPQRRRVGEMPYCDWNWSHRHLRRKRMRWQGSSRRKNPTEAPGNSVSRARLLSSPGNAFGPMLPLGVFTVQRMMGGTGRMDSAAFITYRLENC